MSHNGGGISTPCDSHGADHNDYHGVDNHHGVDNCHGDEDGDEDGGEDGGDYQHLMCFQQGARQTRTEADNGPPCFLQPRIHKAPTIIIITIIIIKNIMIIIMIRARCLHAGRWRVILI